MTRYPAFFILAATLLLTSCGEHREQSELGYFLTLYRSENQESFETATSGFQAWLLTKGLKPVPSPGGTAEWAGMHSTGDNDGWYALPIGGNQLLLRVTVNAHGKEITASTNYGGAYTPGELAEMRHRNHQLWLDIISWFEVNAPENTVSKNPKQRFSEARLKIDDAYTK